ncbi:MAG: hypothetical protein ACRDRX_27470 [Pseudonocardiaceae bacterium]
MSWLELSWILLGALLLVLFGLLLGATWTTQVIRPKLDQQAHERRRLNDQWMALRAARQQLRECPRCGYRFTERGPYLASTLAENPPDDD